MRTVAILLTALMSTATAIAEDKADLVPPAADGGARPFGRLFFSPEQRREMETPQAAIQPPPPSQPQTLPALRLDGIVRPSQGHATVWINGAPAAREEAEALAGGDRARVSNADGSTVVLRVGESYLPDADGPGGHPPTVEIQAPSGRAR